jgi:hypothetical protein
MCANHVIMAVLVSANFAFRTRAFTFRFSEIFEHRASSIFAGVNVNRHGQARLDCVVDFAVGCTKPIALGSSLESKCWAKALGRVRSTIQGPSCLAHGHHLKRNIVIVDGNLFLNVGHRIIPRVLTAPRTLNLAVIC